MSLPGPKCMSGLTRRASWSDMTAYPLRSATAMQAHMGTRETVSLITLSSLSLFSSSHSSRQSQRFRYGPNWWCLSPCSQKLPPCQWNRTDVASSQNGYGLKSLQCPALAPVLRARQTRSPSEESALSKQGERAIPPGLKFCGAALQDWRAGKPTRRIS